MSDFLKQLQDRVEQQEQQQDFEKKVKATKTILHIDTSPRLAASHAMALIRTHGKDANIAEHMEAIDKQAEAIRSGDLTQLEEMLFAQSLILQTMFSQFSTLGAIMLSGNGQNARQSAVELMHVALKAQEQCRKTLLALNEMKNPKRSATFIKSQVNQMNVTGAIETAPAPTELEQGKYAAMDIGSESAAEQGYQTVEAVEVQHGTKKRRRKAKQQPECA